jgi:hypothetical protein
MTREQQVALDAMRSAWPEDVVQRMLRAEDGRIELAVLLTDAWLSAKFVHFDLTGDMADNATLAAAQSHIEDLAQLRLHEAVEIIADGRAVMDPGNERLMWEVDAAFRGTFSPPANQPGASTPQPPGETA